MFAVLTHSPPDNLSPPYLEGISRAAQSLGASVISHQVTNQEAAAMASSRDLPAVFEQGLVSGIILVHRWPERVVRWLTGRWRVISLIHVYPGLPVEIIDKDHEDGIWRLVQHLHQLGHRRFGFLGSCPDIAWAVRRYGGYRSSLMRLGATGGIAVDVPTATLERISDSWRAPLDDAIAHTRAGVTAWVCVYAEAAVFLQQRLREEGLAMPQQVSLSSFEVLHSIGTGTTCLVPPFAEMGTLALERLAVTASGVPNSPAHAFRAASKRAGPPAPAPHAESL